jgi:nicotinate phosphoribosyltransferase
VSLLLGLEDEDPREMERLVLRHPIEQATHRTLNRDDISEIEPLLVDVLKEGKMIYDLPSIEEMHEQRQADMERLDAVVRRIVNPHIYHVFLTGWLWNLKQALMLVHQTPAFSITWLVRAAGCTPLLAPRPPQVHSR